MRAEQPTENHKTAIETLMLSLNPQLTPAHHKQYLAGHIDCLHSTGTIDEETRTALYTEFVG